jgi:hypothetical protein
MSSELESATFQLVAQCLKQLHYRVPFLIEYEVLMIVFHFFFPSLV